ncbi:MULTISPECIES: hypothetical protein [Pseudoalteromonas]|uniref:Orphan protein n=1 Tax=Pseudoalteromonas haloplanktis TaxID=228 RepID=A0ABU1BEH1_PSEHA|nr:MULTISPECIES: hypothetical protein [Pseudoalteromonas]MCF6144242.1 hypothetical protein [Pseudoalteromonas mariniglutinosa NCIMB 1770]MDQ9092705.1 hypothetical protein [Pseudoalteromonas haloplanktis]TMN70579.1 hypothetical protein CWB85_15170 [Pseudoalteromonas sp. S1727]BDF96420.1 hypothetical protein KAN5_32580 [Pseudoalteromonas sp. KAN5]
MLIDYFILKPNRKVAHLTEKMNTIQALKQQHHQAFNYRLKRFAVTKVGIASAFTAGAGYQALNSRRPSSNVAKLSQFSWLLRLL